MEPLLTIDTIFPHTKPSQNWILADIICRFEEYRQIAGWHTIDSQAAAKLRYDEQHNHVEYNADDLVWL